MSQKTNTTNAARDAGQKQIEIISRHATLGEAVEASGMDLSYNPQVARSSIKDIECGFRGAKGGEAFVTLDGVYYVLQCDIRILNKFEPFHSMMTSDPFSPVVITDTHIIIGKPTMPKTSEMRKAIAVAGITVH